MKIQKVQSNGMSFKKAQVNILATADNHGNIMRLPRVIKTIENNAKEIFPKADSPSTMNVFAIVGDWFINPSKKGFLTRPELSNGDLQNIALLKTIDTVKDVVAKTAKKIVPLETLYLAGNHCLDAGDKFFVDVMRKNPMTSLVTNVNLEKSPSVQEAMKASERIVLSQVYSIPDDKNPDLEHKVLFVGATIPSMDFYNPGLLKGMEYFDNCNKKDANLEEKDIQGTINAIKKEVDAFKAENPKGAVILLSHMGGKLSEIVAKSVPQINCVLNGHDHKNVQTNVGKTSVNSLGKDNEMLKALNFEFDDKGNLIKTSMTPYFTETTLADGLEKHPFQIFLQTVFEKDLEPLINLKEVKLDDIPKESTVPTEELVSQYMKKLGLTDATQQKILLGNPEFKKLVEAEVVKVLEANNSVNKGLSKLSYGNEIRYSNSYLMNYLTSAVKRVIREKYAPDVFTVALQSSIVRGGLTDGSNNLDVMKIFDGVSEDLSNLSIGKVKGEELVGLITENILSNLKAPTRNTIIHWSDVQVDRTMISEISTGAREGNYADAIRVRNPLTKMFEPIDMNEEYKMVIGEKFLVKNDIVWPGKIRDRFENLGQTYDQLFREYITSVDYKLHITPKTKEQRIK